MINCIKLKLKVNLMTKITNGKFLFLF